MGLRIIGEFFPPVIRIWVQDETNPDLINCKADGLMKRKGEMLPGTIGGRKVMNIIVSREKPPLLLWSNRNRDHTIMNNETKRENKVVAGNQ